MKSLERRLFYNFLIRPSNRIVFNYIVLANRKQMDTKQTDLCYIYIHSVMKMNKQTLNTDTTVVNYYKHLI